MVDCIGISPGLVYGIQCIVAGFCIITILGAIFNRSVEFEGRVISVVMCVSVLLVMYYISNSGFGGTATPGDLSATDCTSAIFIGK